MEEEPRILVVEDNPMDVLMIRRALKNGGFAKDPIVVDDGVPALAFLKRDSPYENEQKPDLIIMDLNLKLVDGPEVLSYIRQSKALQDLLVIVLSSSPEDTMRSKAATADCYISKPTDVHSFLNLGNKIRSFYACLLYTSPSPRD